MSEIAAEKPELSIPADALPRAAPAILLVVLTIAAYLPALGAGYIWDDDSYLTTNRVITSPNGLYRSWFSLSANPQYYPLVFTTFWIEFRIWGSKAFGYHFDNILLHAANAVLILIVLRKLRVPGAWFAAAIFALHPVNVESVAWITERKNVLSAFFYLSALLAYLRFSRVDQVDESIDGQTPRWAWYPAALLLFSLALFSKTVTCSLPAVILLLLWWRRDKFRIRDVLPLLPFFALGLLMAFVTSWVERHHVHAKDLALNLTPASRVILAGRAVWFYLSKLIWPSGLTFIYPKWSIDPKAPAQYAYSLALLALLIVLWMQRGRIGKAPLVAALIYVGSLLPALGFVDVYPMRYSWVADHFQYLACIAPIAAFAAYLCDRFGPSAQRGPGAFMAIRAVVVGLLAFLTLLQTRIYHDRETLWRDTIAKNEGAWIAHNNLGVVLSETKRLDEAREHLERAIAINPDFTQGYSNLAFIALSANKPEEAIDYCQRAIRVPNAELLDVFNNYGLALYRLGRDEEAASYFEKALKLRGNYVPTRTNLGRALLRLGRHDEAQKQFEIVFRLAPGDSEPRLLLADALMVRGRTDEALTQYRAAAECRPRDPATRLKLVTVLVAAKRLPEALAEAKRLVAIAPRAANAHNLLGSLLIESGETEAAIATLSEAVRLSPDMTEARFNLASALAKAGKNAEAAAQYRDLLRRNPGDAEARRGLDEIERRMRAHAPSSGPSP